MANKIGVTDLQDEWNRLKIEFNIPPDGKEFGDTFLRFHRMGKIYEIRIKEFKQRKK